MRPLGPREPEAAPLPTPPTTDEPVDESGETVLTDYVDMVNIRNSTGARALSCPNTVDQLMGAFSFLVEGQARLTLVAESVRYRKGVVDAKIEGSSHGRPVAGEITAMINPGGGGYCVMLISSVPG